MRAIADTHWVVRALLGLRAGAALMALAIVTGCTRANPAYHPLASNADAAESPGLEADASLPRDRGAPAPDAALPADLFAPEDTAPPADLTAPPDLAAPADLAAPDRSPDLSLNPPLDGGVSSMGLVAHWRFDERTGTTAADATGNGNTGTTHNGPTWTTSGFPGAKFANAGALVLDGQDDYVEIAQKGIPASAASKTVCLWFKAAPSTFVIRNFVALINDTDDVGIQLGIHSGRVAAWYYGYPDPLLATTSQVDGNWHHVAYTFDGATQRLYVDGNLAQSVDMVPASGPILRTRIGTYQAPDEMFGGTIDDMRIYARALSAAEVMILWSGQ
jgi:hypothetical protein